MVVSGNTDFKGAVNIASFATSNLVLNSTAADEPYLRFRDNTVQINRRNADGALLFKDTDLGVTKTLRDLASLSVVDNTDVFTISGGEPSFIKTTGSFSFDSNDRYTTDSIGSSGQPMSDAFFFVSGTIGGKQNHPNIRTVSVFGGDVVISGSLMAERPFFITDLDTAYSTGKQGSAFGSLSPGLGAVIKVFGNRAVQLKGGHNEDVVLGVSGSLDFITGSSDSGVSRIKMINDKVLGFHNSAGEVFRLVNGSSGTAARFEGNNQLRFQGDSRYIYGHTASTVKRLSLVNTDTNGIVAVNAGAGTGHLAVTGSILPGADSSYNLGSPSNRWANLYTGDLHLRNDRGNWTIYEEPDMLVVVNNLTGKKYKMGLTPLEDEA